MTLSRVAHVSGDIPDTIDHDKTHAIEALLALTANRFDHRVVSINRRSPSLITLGERIVRNPLSPMMPVDGQFFDKGVVLRYEAPPRGLYHATMLRRLGDWLAAKLRDDRPNIIIGHKLTIEAIAVARAARLLGVPYGLTIQGDTDTKIIQARPDLRPLFARLFHDARVVFTFAPWALTAVQTSLGGRAGPSICVPCPTELDTPLPPSAGGTNIISLFHLKSRRRKNLSGLVKAARIVERRGAKFRLEIAGGGGEADRKGAERAVDGAGMIDLIGPLGRDEIAPALNRAIGFVLPSNRETFGIVFIEALFAGAPIIYPRGQAVSGYFDGAQFALAVDPKNPREIAEAMLHLAREEGPIKAALADWQRSPAAGRFTRAAIGDEFACGLSAALAAEHNQFASCAARKTD